MPLSGRSSGDLPPEHPPAHRAGALYFFVSTSHSRLVKAAVTGAYALLRQSSRLSAHMKDHTPSFALETITPPPESHSRLSAKHHHNQH